MRVEFVTDPVRRPRVVRQFLCFVKVPPVRTRKPQTVGDIESFVSLIRAACENDKTASTLKAILVMPNTRRQAFLNGLLNDLIIEGAPTDLLEALACLTDDAVAARAYEVVVSSRRGREP